jgi:phosphoribosylaminoimidazole-succinocarboxamide synthase
MTHFWLTQVIMDLPNHLVLDANNFNAASKLTDLFPELPVERCLVVKDFSGQLDEFELIFRKHPGGSIWKDYLETGIISGQVMPEGLTKWQCLDWAIFTPSTKEVEGHDINKEASHYFETMGEASQEFIAALTAAYEQAYAYAKTKGILILDTKFEGSSKLGVLADEVLTPDSSRFCEISNWEESIANKKDPDFWDKQIVREWGKKVETPFGTTGINSLDPKNQEHLDFVHSVEVPGEVIKKVSERYLEIFSKLTGMELYDYQAKKMGIIR